MSHDSTTGAGTKFGYAVAGVIGVGIIAIGARFLLDPVAATAGFGVQPPPVTDPYLDVKGVRDIGAGLVLLALLATGRGAQRRRSVGAAMLAACVIPVGDAVIVLTHGGPAAVAFGVHGATAAVGIAGAVALLHGARRAVPESVRPEEVRV
ncbi:MAG: hypothetical protein QOD82_3023 [Pseudonocardiales bacterium]|nr:hypothetical protein [Pseudonocardiales bacterium]